jgi:hypothetical protein
MGSLGKPGASLRAFRAFDPRVSCVGLDVDPRVLFDEERIHTAVVDQMSLESWGAIPEYLLRKKFDLIIDDGLHSPLANLNTIISTLPMLGSGGILVVEDVPERALDLWAIASALGIQGHEMRIISFPMAYCVVIAKLGALPDLIR